MTEKTKPLFKTDNLVFATSLYSKGHPVTVEMFNSTKAIFCFPHTDQLNADSSLFWSNELAIVPHVYQKKYRELRQKIEEAKSNQINRKEVEFT